MHIWVTRPIEDARHLRAQLIAQGCEVTVEPLLQIEYLYDEQIDLDEAQALIATSRNALRALVGRPEEAACKGMPLFAVGPGTAAMAQTLGFETVIEGPADAGALMGLIVNTAGINDGTLVHLSAENVAYNLCEELRQLGYHVLQPILYRSALVERPNEVLTDRFRSGRIDGVVLLSGRTADAYVRVVRRAGLQSEASTMTHFCLSPAIAARLSPLQLADVRVSSRPNVDAVLALTGAWAENKFR